MNKRSIVSLSILGIIFGCISLAISFIFLKTLPFEDIVIPLVLPLLSLSLLLLPTEKKTLSWVFMVSAIVLTISNRGVVSIFCDKAKAQDAMINIAYGLIPYTAIIPLIGNRKKHKVLLLCVSAAIFPLVYLISQTYTLEYCYIYKESVEYASTWMVTKVALFSLLVAVLSKIVFDANRNYLSYVSIVVSAFSFGLRTSIEGGVNTGFWGYIRGIAASPFFWWLLFPFVIYIIVDTPEKKIMERRNIVFKDMVYQEVKPIRKRARKSVFEIPPNVPKFRHDLTLRKESENKNTEHNGS